MRTLVVNADDFGFAADVNRGIVKAHREGILTATTLMANGDAFDDAIRLANENPTLDVGVHGVLVQGDSVATARKLPANVKELVVALLKRQLDPYLELTAQVRKILAAGIRPTHIDTHKHTHLIPSVLDAVCRVAHENGIGYVRRPFDLPLSSSRIGWKRQLTARALHVLDSSFRRKLLEHDLRSTDHFTGFTVTGRFTDVDLIRMFRELPNGITEFMCHPGHCSDELRKKPTRLKECREQELSALTSPGVRQILGRERIEIGSYARLLNRLHHSSTT